MKGDPCYRDHSHPCEAKVANLDVAVTVEEDVGGLEVSMEHRASVLGVAVLHRPPVNTTTVSSQRKDCIKSLHQEKEVSTDSQISKKIKRTVVRVL